LVIVVDDAVQGVSELTRGEDLFEVTYLHRTHQALPGLPNQPGTTHRLCRDERGERLA
jgi:glutamyl-Q tRNA(Asp) synthetase